MWRGGGGGFGQAYKNLLGQVVYQSKDDQVTVVAAGQTLHEALAAAEHLKKGKCFLRNICLTVS